MEYNKKMRLLSTILMLLFLLSACTNRHNRLSEVSHDANHIYKQLRKPSREEIAAGQQAIETWKQTDKHSRNRLADDIVLGKNLVGMNVESVISKLGPPWGQVKNDSNFRPFGYDALGGGESQCDLVLEISPEGVVEETYLDVNY